MGRKPTQGTHGRKPAHPAGRGPAPRGFSRAGFRQVNDWLMPGLAGAEKRAYHNQVSGWVVLAAGLVGSGLGAMAFGWFGGLLGLGLGISLGGSFVERQRFYRG